MKRLLILMLAFPLLFCATERQNDEAIDVVDLPPADNEISGWTRDSDMQIAENETQLFDLIDGEGQIYVDNGFVKSAFQSFVGDISGTQVDLDLRVFDMGNSTNSKNVYDAVGLGSETQWTNDNAGTEARINEGLLFAYEIDFWQNRFFVRVTIGQKSDTALDIAKLFAINVSDAIAAGNGKSWEVL
jgi:hypothetical protein